MSEGHATRPGSQDLFSVLLLLTLAWGALAFGAVYPWVYVPLLGSTCVLGLWGLLRSSQRGTRHMNQALAAGCALVALAVAAQLVSLPRSRLAAISPATDRVLQAYDVAYAVGVLSRDTVAHALSIDVEHTWIGLAFVCVLSIYLLGLTRALDGLNLRRLLPGLVGLGAVVAAVGVIQRPLFSGRIYGLWTPIGGPLLFTPSGGPFGPFVNRNHFAGWMLMVIPISVGYFSALAARGLKGVKPNWRSRLAWLSSVDANRAVLVGFAILFMTLSLVLTLSRSGVTCLIVALAISTMVVLRRQNRWSKRVTVIGLVVATGLIGVTTTGADAIAARFNRVDATLDGRLFAWRDAWNVIEAFPLTGTGLNTYGTSMLFYQSFHRGSVHFAEAHNDYLQLLAEGGLLLAIPTLMLVALFVWQVSSRFRERADDVFGYWVRVGSVTGLVAIGLQEIVDFSLQMPGNAVLFVLLCGIAVRKARGRPMHSPVGLFDGSLR